MKNRYPTATMEEWTAECIGQGLIDREAKPIRAMMSKYRLQLIGHNMIAANHTVVWTLT
jgi:hypothetical protein